MPKKKKIVKSSVEEEPNNGNDRRMLDSKNMRSCPYCDKQMKKSRLPHHINHQHDQTCPKCPTVVGLKANEFLRHWKSPEHYAKIGYNCKVESVQDFLIKLGIKPKVSLLGKPLMHLQEISIFSLNNVIVRLAKIMNRANKNQSFQKMSLI